MRSGSGHDSSEASSLRGRRLGHDQQVGASLVVMLSSVHAQYTCHGPHNVGGQQVQVCFRLWWWWVGRRHTKPVPGRAVTRHTACWHPSRTALSDTVAQYDANVPVRGSQFLKAWMGFLEEHADLRYPNLADVYVDEQDG
jgi:hypothetical protein